MVSRLSADYFDDRIVGCYCRILVPATVIQTLATIVSVILPLETSDEASERIEPITYYIQEPILH